MTIRLPKPVTAHELRRRVNRAFRDGDHVAFHEYLGVLFDREAAEAARAEEAESETMCGRPEPVADVIQIQTKRGSR